MFTVQVNVPLPARTGPKGLVRGSKYPFATMEIGASFFVPSTEDKPVKAATLRSAVGAYMKNDKSRRFAVRQVNEDGVDGVRVWRVEPKADTE